MTSEFRITFESEYSRQNESLGKLKLFQKSFSSILPSELSSFVTIYATGSYGRLEASDHSDLDLFFITKLPSDLEITRLDDISFFGKVIDLNNNTFKLPKPSNKGQYLKFITSDSLISNMGNSKDDYENSFTARLLYLLESKPLFNDELYRKVKIEIIESYYRNYKHFPKEFRPHYLLNDIKRYWLTMCANFEHSSKVKKNNNEIDSELELKISIKNYKLKFSRLFMCSATLIAALEKSPTTPEDFYELTNNTPIEKFFQLQDDKPEFREKISNIFSLYQMFLQNTALSTEELEAKFRVKAEKKELFEYADKFGDAIVELMIEICQTKHSSYKRYLIL